MPGGWAKIILFVAIVISCDACSRRDDSGIAVPGRHDSNGSGASSPTTGTRQWVLARRPGAIANTCATAKLQEESSRVRLTGSSGSKRSNWGWQNCSRRPRRLPYEATRKARVFTFICHGLSRQLVIRRSIHVASSRSGFPRSRSIVTAQWKRPDATRFGNDSGLSSGDALMSSTTHLRCKATARSNSMSMTRFLKCGTDHLESTRTCRLHIDGAAGGRGTVGAKQRADRLVEVLLDQAVVGVPRAAGSTGRTAQTLIPVHQRRCRDAVHDH